MHYPSEEPPQEKQSPREVGQQVPTKHGVLHSTKYFSVKLNKVEAKDLPAEVTIGVRPEKTQINKSSGKDAHQIQVIEPLGREKLIYLDARTDEKFVSLITSESAEEINDNIVVNHDKLLDNKGPRHKPLIKVSVKIKDSKNIIAIGNSKKEAEQKAAKKLLTSLKLL